MKRVVNGVTFNTCTSTLVARSEWWQSRDTNNAEDEDMRVEQELYLTRGGAFFLAHMSTWKEWDADDRRTYEHRSVKFKPLTREQAQGWVLRGEVEVLDSSVLGEPPEAEAEEKPAATIYVRVPTSLKARVEDAAKRAGVSLNAWVQEAVELRLAQAQAA
jgi:HicB family